VPWIRIFGTVKIMKNFVVDSMEDPKIVLKSFRTNALSLKMTVSRVLPQFQIPAPDSYRIDPTRAEAFVRRP